MTTYKNPKVKKFVDAATELVKDKLVIEQKKRSVHRFSVFR
ncbi:MAG: hypothetical protein V1899_08350 [Planctomycetota bacterium]